MVDYLNTAVSPFTFNPTLWYMGYTAVGGYAGAAALAKYQAGALPPLGSKFMVESAIVGGATGWVVLMLSAPDLTSMAKAIGVGALGQWAWFKFLRPMAVNWNVVA